MNAKSLLKTICNLKWQLDVADPEDAQYIERQIEEQMDNLQSITSLPKASLRRVIAKLYVEWLDGKIEF
jgi:hypothetical protein